MAATVVDSANQIEFMAAGKPVPVVDEKVVVEPVAAADEKSETKADVKAETPQEDEDGLTAEDRERLGAKKYDKVIARRHRLQKEAEEARDEAEAFAQNQYRERRAAEGRAQELERQLAALQKPVVEKTEDAEPQETDEKYKDNAKLYWQDWAKWTARQELKAEREKEANEKAQAALESRRQALMKKVSETAKEIPDYDEVISKAIDRIPDYVAQFIEESDIGPRIGYHLAKHPEVLERLTRLSPIKAIAEIGKLEATLSVETSQKPPESKIEPTPAAKSRAPEPIAPLSGGTGTVHKPLAEMNTRETIEYWQERDKAKANRRQRH